MLCETITTVNEAAEKEWVDMDLFLERLLAKLIAEAQYHQTNSKRACITLIFPRNTKEALKQTIPDSSLFGSDLTKIIKQIKEGDTLLDANKDSTEQKGSGNEKSLRQKTLLEESGQFRVKSTSCRTKIVLQRGYSERSAKRRPFPESNSVPKHRLQTEVNVGLKIGERLKNFYKQRTKITKDKFVLS